MSSRDVLTRIERRFARWRYGGAPERDHWLREVMYKQVDAQLRALPAREHSALEISGQFYADLGWREYVHWHYPDFDVCRPGDITQQFDVVICDQVLEHVVDPFTAVRTLRDLCVDGGYVVVGVPFLVRVHPAPADYWRFTPDGLRVLLESAGLDVPQVMSFGNRRCVKANFLVWASKPRWASDVNEPEFPVNVWAIARKPVTAASPRSS
jgi:hypothetical protein